MYRLGIKWFCRQGKIEVKKVIHQVQKNKTKQETENRKASNWKKFKKFHELVTVAILMPTSPSDINVLTRGALVLETKDSFVSPVTNLNKKTLFVNSDVLNRIQLVDASYCKYCSLIFYDFIWLVSSFLFVQSFLMGCSRIPVNKDTNPKKKKKR